MIVISISSLFITSFSLLSSFVLHFPSPGFDKLNTHSSFSAILSITMADNLPVEVNENNTPDRNERNIVPEGNRKVSYKKESDNSGCFTFEGEDHTLGAPLRMKLLRDPNVVFAGYKVPNPLARNLEVRIETTSESSPMQAYNQAINDLDRELDHLKNAFEAEMARFSRDQ